MSDYTKSTDFASKDTLPSGDSAKIVRGTEIDAEFEALEVAIATKANTSDVSSTYAPLNSPTFTGSPVLPTGTTAVTQTAGDNDTSVATTAFVTTAVAALGYPSFKNRIINGAMMIDQRNAGSAITGVTAATGRVYPVDRNGFNNYSDGVCTTQQSTTVPAGFKNSLYATVTTADASVGATQFCAVEQRIEGLNVADLGWGTANAQSVTLSFWVRSSLTGTYCAAIYNSSGARSYVATYTINAADTWEYKTITIAGDTTGTWLTTNGVGLHLSFCLGVGSSYQQAAGSWSSTAFAIGTSSQANWIGTLNATFYITGVQLEKGSTATSFDYRPYGTELALCQRYCFVNKPAAVNAPFGAGVQYTSGLMLGYAALPVPMRTAPSMTYSALSDFSVISSSVLTPTLITYNGANPYSVRLDISVTGAVAGQGAVMTAANTNTILTYSAEL